MTTSPVGMRCPECARHTTKVRTVRNTRKRFGVTEVLIAINVIVFLAEGSTAWSFAGAPGSSWVLNHGLLYAPYIRFEHYYWTPLTSGFIHLSIIHILSNMYVLYWVGRLLEPAIGRRRFMAIYFTGLLAGSLGVFVISPHSPTAGASGAIFGLLGAAFAEAQRRGVDQVRNQLVILIVLNLVLTVSLPGISIGAHLGGLVGGGLTTLGFNQGDRVRQPAVGWAICALIVAASVVGTIVIADHTSLS
ncbi:MAG: rhomboid family intramembrane serine protease [Solirubrobacteraceae bacterium]